MQMTRRHMLGAGAAVAATATFAPEAFGGWEPSESYPDPAIKILDPSFARYRVNNAGVERLATGMRWSEGPVWMGDARCLLWSDIPNNRIMRWDEDTGATSVYRAPSNNANGSTRDRHALGRGTGLLPGRPLRAVQRHPQQPHHAVLGG